MTFGERILTLRKKLKWSQDDLAKKIGTSAPIVGRYERNEIKPSIDTAKNIADALDVTIDYLVGDSDVILDKNTISKIQEISNMSPEDQGHVFSLIDAFIAKTKLKGLI